ncbi:redoxin domain-containing protein [Roseovarius nitratireducens]|uniref:redoxin domain-containing protein n=1 Tax=Roseovarius nitratireducens TaxID=2044597 RepID=UPI000CE263C4|nr:redoxin domain-containing protein [Roseovarius nitratireducens]
MSIQFFTPRGPKNEIIRLPTALRKTVRWLPQIGDVFPDFSVETTEGDLNFWEWAEGSWIHLFSHPAANTPVCTTEMAAITALSEDWQKINVKHLALSGSSLDEQHSWHADIARLFGLEVDFPCAHDSGLQLSRLFGMMHDKEDANRPIRKSFLIDPGMRVAMLFEYPLFVGRNIEEVLRVAKALQMHADTGAATPADWQGGDMVIIPDNRSEQEVIRQFGTASELLLPYLRVTGAT